MKNLLIILPFLSFAQNVVNDTLFISGIDVQLVELQNRNTSQRWVIDEVAFGEYIHPFTNTPKGTYTLSIFKDRKRYVTTVKDTVEYDPKPLNTVDKYYCIRQMGSYKSSGYYTKAEIVAFIDQNNTDFLTKTGRKNSIEVYEVRGRNKKLVYKR